MKGALGAEPLPVVVQPAAPELSGSFSGLLGAGWVVAVQPAFEALLPSGHKHTATQSAHSGHDEEPHSSQVPPVCWQACSGVGLA